MIDLRTGDCLEILRGLPDASVDAVVTDPPYGMNYQSKKGSVANDERPFIWFLHDAFRVTKDGGSLVCFTNWRNQEAWRIAIECAGFKVRSHCIWDRAAHGMGDTRAAFAPQHDVFWFATKGRFAFPSRRPVSVIRDKKPAPQETPHPTAKPVGLMRQICSAVAPIGGTILDPFAGSGATGVAAVMEGMRFIGIELVDSHAEFARARIEAANENSPIAPHAANG
jgi:DNA modification methylase